MKLYGLILFSVFLAACGSYPPIRTVDNVDIDRFLGKWYVIANIPTFIEKGAHNATETYSLRDDGRIQTVFEFNQDNFDGEKKTYRPVGRILDQSNAVWGMQFIWPIEADYRIIYLDMDYQTTIIGRIKRDYVWLMARQPEISDREFLRLKGVISDAGYDTRLLQRVPQQTFRKDI